MAISTGKSNLSVEFTYEVEEGSDAQILVKYHTTEELGPTISLSIDGTEWFAFPATLFPEVTDFLRSEYGVFQTKRRTVPAQQRSGTTSFIPPTGLTLPAIVGEDVAEVSGEPPEPVVMADVNPVQSLRALASGNIDYTAAQIVEAQSIAQQNAQLQAAQQAAAATVAAVEQGMPPAPGEIPVVPEPALSALPPMPAAEPAPRVASLSERAKQNVTEPVARPVTRSQKEVDMTRLTDEQIKYMNDVAHEGMANEDKKIMRTG